MWYLLSPGTGIFEISVQMSSQLVIKLGQSEALVHEALYYSFQSIQVAPVSQTVTLIFTDLVRCGTCLSPGTGIFEISVQMSSQLVLKLGQF